MRLSLTAVTDAGPRERLPLVTKRLSSDDV